MAKSASRGNKGSDSRAGGKYNLNNLFNKKSDQMLFVKGDDFTALTDGYVAVYGVGKKQAPRDIDNEITGSQASTIAPPTDDRYQKARVMGMYSDDGNIVRFVGSSNQNYAALSETYHRKLQKTFGKNIQYETISGNVDNVGSTLPVKITLNNKTIGVIMPRRFEQPIPDVAWRGGGSNNENLPF